MDAGMKSLLLILKYTRSSTNKILLACTFSILNILLDALPEVILGFAIDSVVNREHSYLSTWGIDNSYTQLFILGGISILVYGLESFFEYLYSITWKDLAQLIQHKLRIDAYQHIQKLDMQYFEEKSTGLLLNILVDDINLLEQFFNNVAHDILQIVIGTILITCIFLYVSPTITFIAMLPIPVIFFISYLFQNKLTHYYAKVRESAGIMAERLSTNLFGISTIKNYTTEQHEINEVSEISKNYMTANSKAIAISSLFIPIVRIAIVTGYMVTLVLGGTYVLDGVIAVGAYSTLVFLTQRLLWPFTNIARLVDTYHRTMASAHRILDLIATPIHVKDGDLKLETSKVKGEIIFDYVSFAYPNRTKIFSNLSFNILPKQTVAFVGPTGSGKTTITKLLLRYYHPTSGIISLDNTDIQNYTLKSLRNAFGVVSQDIFLIPGTVEENIRYGSFDASFDKIVAAAKAAEAYEFIQQLPQQFKTKIGERGQKLSGGQKQRISLARALLKNPPIYIFDEATSAVDNETERAIHHSLQSISTDHTVIIIAHRLSTVKNADIIYVLDDGKIVESGTHNQLIKNGKLYAHLWNLQTNDSHDV